MLVILGCYAGAVAGRLVAGAWPQSPVNAAVRLAVAASERLRPAGTAPLKAPIAPPDMPLPRIRREAAALLPGCRVRRLLFWRYLLVFATTPSPTGA